jgi:predicted PurR-regulated permease PerM
MPEQSGAPPPREPALAVAHERRWIRTDVILLVAAVAVLFWLAGDVLLLVFAALLLAVGLDGLARVISDYTPLSRRWALSLVLALTLGFLVLFGMLVVPPFIEQLAEMWHRTVDFVEDQVDRLRELGWARDLMDGSQNHEQVAGAAGTVAGHVAKFTMMLVGGVASFLILISIALFAAYSPGLYRHGLVRLFPIVYRDRLERALSAIAHALRWWFLGQLVSMALLGVTVSVGLLVIGVELWLGLGVLTALLTFIPFLGPIIAGVPIVIVGFGEGAEVGLIVLAFYLVVQNIEGNIVVPIIQHRAVHLAPALLISVQVLLSVLFGVMGLILAAPLTVVAMVAVQKLYMEDVLGEETDA